MDFYVIQTITNILCSDILHYIVHCTLHYNCYGAHISFYYYFCSKCGALAYIQKLHVFISYFFQFFQLCFHHSYKRQTVIIPQKQKKPWRNWVTCGWVAAVVFSLTVQAVWRLTLFTIMVLAASLCQAEAAEIWLSSGMPRVGFDPLPSFVVTGPVHIHYHFHLGDMVYWLFSSVQSQLKDQKPVHQHREKGREFFSPVIKRIVFHAPWSFLAGHHTIWIIKCILVGCLSTDLPLRGKVMSC